MRILLLGLAIATCFLGLPAAAQEQGRPNILVIFGDDIGQTRCAVPG
jgi:hypothetical protein